MIWITRGHVRGVALNVNFAIPGALRIDVVEFLSREPVHPLPPPEEVVKAPVLLHNNNNVINRMGYRQHRHHGSTYHHCPHRIYGLVCLLPELLFLGTGDAFSPSRVKIMINPKDAHTAGFSAVRRLECDENICLANSSEADAVIYRTSQLRFSSVSSLALWVDESIGGTEETHLTRVEFFGESTKVPTQRQAVPGVVYEARGNPADHPELALRTTVVQTVNGSQ